MCITVFCSCCVHNSREKTHFHFSCISFPSAPRHHNTPPHRVLLRCWGSNDLWWARGDDSVGFLFVSSPFHFHFFSSIFVIFLHCFSRVPLRFGGPPHHHHYRAARMPCRHAPAGRATSLCGAPCCVVLGEGEAAFPSYWKR